jgi:uncharacterized protein (TIGR00730 family)
MEEKDLPKPERKVYRLNDPQRRAIAKSTRELRSADEEFDAAFQILQKYPRRVTFFGSARLNAHTKYYRLARELSGKLAGNGFAIMSGGGGGIMEASDRGAYEGDDVAIGFNIKLPHEQHVNPYTTEQMTFNFFFTRKVMMTFYAEAFVIFPGGYGTFDECFEVLTLMQTGKMPRVPVFLVGKDFWKGIDKFIKKHMLKSGLISKGDEKLYTITDDVKSIHRKLVRDNVEARAKAQKPF